MIGGRPAFAGYPGRLVMKGRHAAELSHALARALRASIAARDRRVQLLQRQLDTFGVDRRLAAVRSRLVSADGRLTTAITRRRHRADLQLRNCAGRLDTLSPLAVLGRGYAVAWNADKTRVIRDASRVSSGDIVRVTLSRGELDCEVRSAHQIDTPDESRKPRI
jgi:exodeoxyribonuclease VII large subunit